MASALVDVMLKELINGEIVEDYSLLVHVLDRLLSP